MSTAGNISDMCGLKELSIVPINLFAMKSSPESSSRPQVEFGTVEKATRQSAAVRQIIKAQERFLERSSCLWLETLRLAHIIVYLTQSAECRMRVHRCLKRS